MLRTLHVANLGVLEDVETDFPVGLVCLTGETGAGKSLLVDAIKLLLGARADAGDVRHGAREALVEAAFDVSGHPGVVAALEAAGYEADDGEVRLRRTVGADGRGKAWIQGRLASARELREIGGRLVSVAGQHAFIGLGVPRERLDMLDAYAGTAAELATFGERFEAFETARRGLRELEKARSDRAARQDYLEHVIGQIDAVRPVPGELERLAGDLQVLRGAQRLRELGGQAVEDLYEGARSAFDAAGRALQSLHDMARIDPGLGGMATRLESAQIEVREASRDLSTYLERLDDDPGRLAAIEERQEALKGLVRRYGGSIEAALATADAARDELARIAGAGETSERLAEEAARLETEVRDLAARLSERRREAAARMSAVVTEAVRGLAMAGATLEVRVEPADLSETGADRVDFRIETNPGEGWGEVADVASGGELSRITLALFSALSATVGTPVMVYDEIDAGVSGAVADRMGEVLAQAARARQVLVVTHHGQVAARAAAHFRIGKQTTDGRTAASLERLDETGRVEETARMLGGRTVTETVLAHARELLLPL